uniref:Predicted protein n=1 Tax=Hordeum vulgare subsp. vulgare TaxID=112509 RepID=F2CSL1_HORVV|nr:predicted protein [Hordeum vulgare subsp. vulgare]BAK02543.1 predicted protein [Hordeum vulgare subsp. vulgare]
MDRAVKTDGSVAPIAGCWPRLRTCHRSRDGSVFARLVTRCRRDVGHACDVCGGRF